MERLSAKEARRLQLWAQGLGGGRRPRAQKTDVLEAIRRMKLLQIDTIHVVARSPLLVLYSRLGAFEPRWLLELLEEGHVLECWAHEACFAPAERYPWLRHHQLDRERHWAIKHALRMQREHKGELLAILQLIEREGPKRAADFEAAAKGKGGWWGWKDEKRWLEALFALGQLMITRRDGFQRVYDLRDRVLQKRWPEPSSIALPGAEEQAERSVLDAVEALGVTEAEHIADYFRTGRRHRDAELQPLVDRGALVRVEVEGWRGPGYLAPAALAALAALAPAPRTVLLSPFDPIVWDRARARAVFGFDYRIECYLPEGKRSFGYYVLPILDGDRLVGRLDAKAHRSAGFLEVKALFLEDGVGPSAAFLLRLRRALLAFARWHQTPALVLGKGVPRALRGALADGA